jgi:hypothetical protein
VAARASAPPVGSRPRQPVYLERVINPLRPVAVIAAIACVAPIAGCGGGSGSTGEESEPAFAPRASLRAVGGTTRTSKPEFVLRVEPRPGEPSLKSVAVELPPVVLVDPTSFGRFCSERELAADECAGRPRLGFARVASPAYGAPLKGTVYPVTGSGGLPRLAYLLKGPANILLRGRVVSKGGTITAGVDDVPDIPFDEFVLRVDGGKDGFLVLSRDICNGSPTATGTFTSQDGQVSTEKIPLDADCSE